MADATTVFELAANAASNVGDRLTEQAARTPRQDSAYHRIQIDQLRQAR